jgi:WD40 repeat protein
VEVWDVQKEKLQWATKENQPNAADVKARPDPQQAQPDVGCVFCLSFSPDGKMVAAADKDGKVRLFDSQTGGLKQALDGHSESVGVVAFSHDGKILASGSCDQTVKLWDAQTGKLLETLKGTKAWGSALAFAPDGSLLGTGGEIKDDKLTVEVIRIHAQGVELKQVFQDPVSGPWTRFAFSPDGKTLAIGAGSGGNLQDHRTTGQLMFWRLESQPTKKKLSRQRTGSAEETKHDHIEVTMSLPDQRFRRSHTYRSRRECS